MLISLFTSLLATFAPLSQDPNWATLCQYNLNTTVGREQFLCHTVAEVIVARAGELNNRMVDLASQIETLTAAAALDRPQIATLTQELHQTMEQLKPYLYALKALKTIEDDFRIISAILPELPATEEQLVVIKRLVALCEQIAPLLG